MNRTDTTPLKPAGSQGPIPDPLSEPIGLPWWKRVIDIGLVLLTAPVWLPLMAVIAVLVRFSSPGPVLFQQVRIGYRGWRFTCFKFRTMHVNADTSIHQDHLTRLIDSNLPMKKLDAAGDPRLISCGRILRSSGLDELPQLFNVLQGEMSLVGPRPCLPYEYESYTPRHRARFQAVPGLTGLWQVSGKNSTTFEQMIDLDIYYARNKSPWMDLKIIFKTIPAMVAQYRETAAEPRVASQALSAGPSAPPPTPFHEDNLKNRSELKVSL
jgi:lipopolysaccharide/colanic/teichoic acid biosynthesis glycosyltransferase